MDIFWGHHIFGLLKFQNIFLGCLNFLIFFWGERWMLGPSLRIRKKFEYPPLGDILMFLGPMEVHDRFL